MNPARSQCTVAGECVLSWEKQVQLSRGRLFERDFVRENVPGDEQLGNKGEGRCPRWRTCDAQDSVLCACVGPVGTGERDSSFSLFQLSSS